jgi:hypothetical protein
MYHPFLGLDLSMSQADAVPQSVSPEADTGVMELPVQETPSPATLQEVKELLRAVLVEVRSVKADQELIRQEMHNHGTQIAQILESLSSPQVEIGPINVHVDTDPEEL